MQRWLDLLQELSLGIVRKDIVIPEIVSMLIRCWGEAYAVSRRLFNGCGNVDTYPKPFHSILQIDKSPGRAQCTIVFT